MKLTQAEQQVVQEAEEARARAMAQLEHGENPVILAQDLAAAGELLLEAASIITVRARREAKAAKTARPA